MTDLTDEELKRMRAKHAPNVGGIFDFAREVIAADRAKRRPMTRAQIEEFEEDGVFLQNCKLIVRDIERFHGITS